MKTNRFVEIVSSIHMRENSIEFDTFFHSILQFMFEGYYWKNTQNYSLTRKSNAKNRKTCPYQGNEEKYQCSQMTQ